MTEPAIGSDVFAGLAKRDGQELPTALRFIEGLWHHVEALPPPRDTN